MWPAPRARPHPTKGTSPATAGCPRTSSATWAASAAAATISSPSGFQRCTAAGGTQIQFTARGLMPAGACRAAPRPTTARKPPTRSVTALHWKAAPSGVVVCTIHSPGFSAGHPSHTSSHSSPRCTSKNEPGPNAAIRCTTVQVSRPRSARRARP
eukprot:4980127-Lingulodinium_polyedra.AAC.1